MICASTAEVSLMSFPAINSSGSFSPATVNVFENTLPILSLDIVILYVIGVDLYNGTVNGVKSSNVLRSLVRFKVGPVPEEN